MRILCGLLLLAVIGLRYAEPVGDGDLFWQMEYGRQLLERGTLIPDHSVYSWTPGSNLPIYCAWVAEIALYKIGLPGLFAVRYLCVLVAVGLGASYLGLRRWECWPLLLMLVLPPYLGTMLKPELFSFLFLNVLAWGYYARPRGFLVALPLLMILWANTHGVFVFGLLAVGAMVVVEALNRTLTRPFLASAGASFLSLVLTPYGWRYPASLWRELLQTTPGDQAAYHYVAAHNSIFQASGMHFLEYFAFMALTVILLWRRGGDWGLVVFNLLFGALYLWYLRTTFYWAPFWFYSVALALRGRTVPRWLTGVGLALFVGWSLRAGWEAVYRPYSASWCGFGVSYRNPEVEAEWVRRFHPTSAVVNDYDSGGYLLPRFKVMIDGRSFPYREWIIPYIQWEGGANFGGALQGAPDVAVISVKNSALWSNFLRSPDWQLAWLGPSAAVFSRKGKAYPDEARAFAPDRFRRMRNAEKALQVFQLAVEASLFDLAGQIADGCPPGEVQETMRHFLAAVKAWQAGDKDTARREMGECKRLGRFWSDQLLQ